MFDRLDVRVGLVALMLSADCRCGASEANLIPSVRVTYSICICLPIGLRIRLQIVPSPSFSEQSENALRCENSET